MRKLSLIIITLLLATSCFAQPTVYIGTGSSFQNAQTNIGTSATSLGATTGTTSLYLKPSSYNFGMIYIGDSNVTTTKGLELATNSVTKLDINTVSGLYAVSTIPNQKLTVLTIVK